MSFPVLLARDGCKVCPDTIPPCPTCPGDQTCTAVIPDDTCHECPKNVCAAALPMPTAPPQPSSNGPSTGAIAGGVIGGVALIAAVTYLVWRFCIKTKRQPLESEAWDEEQDHAGMGAEKDFQARRDARSSVHTVHSIASTVLTRASNIIQIAYIPGVTNRATPTSPTLLVPPVPPIPIAVSQANSPANPEDQHFFVPGDLRGSTYSGMSGYSDRTSYARTSYAPRSSIASTIYGKSAVVVAPVQHGLRAKPAMVGVKSTSSSGSGSGGSTPPVPSIDLEKYKIPRPPSPANSTFSVGSTFLNNASAATAMTAKPMIVRVGSVKKVANKAPEAHPLATMSTAAEEPHTTVRDSNAVTIIEDSPAVDQGPFADPPKKPTHQKNNSLSAVIEEATRRASQRTSTNGSSAERERSPFGDEHATREQ